jgi:hypothetical protein
VATPSVDRERHLSEDACNPHAQESFAELVGQSLLITGLPLLRRILDRGSPLIEAGRHFR